MCSRKYTNVQQTHTHTHTHMHFAYHIACDHVFVCMKKCSLHHTLLYSICFSVSWKGCNHNIDLRDQDRRCTRLLGWALSRLTLVIVMFERACSWLRKWSALPEAIVLAEGEALAPFMSMQDLPAWDTLSTCRLRFVDVSSQTAKKKWNALWNLADIDPWFPMFSVFFNTMMSRIVFWCCILNPHIGKLERPLNHIFWAALWPSCTMAECVSLNSPNMRNDNQLDSFFPYNVGIDAKFNAEPFYFLIGIAQSVGCVVVCRVYCTCHVGVGKPTIATLNGIWVSILWVARFCGSFFHPHNWNTNASWQSVERPT